MSDRLRLFSGIHCIACAFEVTQHGTPDEEAHDLTERHYDDMHYRAWGYLF